MSPSGTMVRVYAELKRRVMDGDLRPGVRLDPAKLGKEMLSSMTPVREALHQLKGEGIVESWKHEGFWIAELSEPVIRDRYEWCRELVFLCLRSATARPSAITTATTGDTYADGITDLLLRIAALSINQEHWRSMLNLCDRTSLLRKTEAAILEDPMSDLRLLQQKADNRAWDEFEVVFEKFHQRRMEIITPIATALRPR